MAEFIPLPTDYPALLEDLKTRIRSAQLRAALTLNRETIQLYWSIGKDLSSRFAAEGWGTKVVGRLAKDLGREFLGMEGFSLRNLRYMRSFAEAWPDSQSLQLAAKLPWGHHMVLLDRVKDGRSREWYLQASTEHGWSRNVLTHHISTGLREREGKALTHFSRTLPADDSDLTQQILSPSAKDTYFVSLVDWRWAAKSHRGVRRSSAGAHTAYPCRVTASRVSSALCLILVMVFAALAQAQSTGPLLIDASEAAAPTRPAQYQLVAEDAVSNDGHRLGLNNQYLTRGGRPWLPVMGEMHYTRVPEAEWEEQILKMKSAGVEIVATYIIWIHHEEIQGQWEWKDGKDLRRFVQLCAKHGMYVVPRIGPWSHAEVRNGGFPDWLMKNTTQRRTDDPVYLGYVHDFYNQIGKQLQGLMWKDGGPVIAVQLENEYRGRGAVQGAEHILTLKRMALEAGLHVPFFTVTGWDGAVIPAGQVLPVYGGYPDAPWDASVSTLPASEVYAFRFGSRVTGDMGAQNGDPMKGPKVTGSDTPFFTAEMGGGMQVTYHRRPVVSPDDIAAMMPVMLGSGVNLYGSYMFQGGENPDGRLTTLQESLATHAPNDLPVKSYDFEAPLGEFGDERPSLLKLKTWDYLLNDFGEELAPMMARRPAITPASPADLSVARVSVRSLGNSGFLFVNNHVREHAMPARPGFQVSVKLPNDGTLLIPEKPLTLPADSYFVWPFHEDLSGLHLRYATAQPLAKLGSHDSPVYAFFAQPGIPAEFVIEDEPGLKLDRTAGMERKDGAVWIRGLTPGIETQVVITLKNGRTVTLLLLRQEDAEQGWRVQAGGVSALLLTPQQAFVDGDTATLENIGKDEFEARIAPGKDLKIVGNEAGQYVRGGSGKSLQGVTPPQTDSPRLPLRQIRREGTVGDLPPGFAPSRKPRVVAAMPTDDEWLRAGVWSVTLPEARPELNARRFLRVDFVGDVARLYAGDHLLTDDFWDGRPWLIGLERFRGELKDHKLTLSVYPLREHAPVFFEPGTILPSGSPQALSVRSVELLTEYRRKVRLVANPNREHP